jgi:Predicted signal-transduction protein containing cAMP-binding and CBS domains
MTPDPVTMPPGESMRNAAVLMSQKNLHRLPIVDNGKLVGMLTSSDVMIDMVRVVNSLPSAAEDDLISP